jgi:hypothetical protein
MGYSLIIKEKEMLNILNMSVSEAKALGVPKTTL